MFVHFLVFLFTTKRNDLPKKGKQRRKFFSYPIFCAEIFERRIERIDHTVQKTVNPSFLLIRNFSWRGDRGRLNKPCNNLCGKVQDPVEDTF